MLKVCIALVMSRLASRLGEQLTLAQLWGNCGFRLCALVHQPLLWMSLAGLLLGTLGASAGGREVAVDILPCSIWGGQEGRGLKIQPLLASR